MVSFLNCRNSKTIRYVHVDQQFGRVEEKRLKSTELVLEFVV